MKQFFPIVGAVVALGAAASPAWAQRAGENAVASAADAFGNSIGNETIGLYNPNDTRGFSPGQAGNVRLEGLYIDLQGPISGRALGGSNIHVGISAQSYPFVAPTGVVAFRLKIPREVTLVSTFIGYGAYNTFTTEVDVQTPIVKDKLSITFGAGGSRSDNDFAVKSWNWSAGTVARWRPSDAIEVLGFASGQNGYDVEQQPQIFPAGAYFPNEETYPRRTFLGQDWTDFNDQVSQYGGIVRADLGDNWTFRAGLFQSRTVTVSSFSDLLLNVQPDGRGDHVIVAIPRQSRASLSGEARLAKVIVDGPRRHTLHGMLRGRRVHRTFGGSDVRSFGTAFINTRVILPEPVFNYGVIANDHADQGTGGLAYEGFWTGVGEFSVGVQKSFYRRKINQPGLPVNITRSKPWIYNGTVSVTINPSLAVYASYARGLEESGMAPNNANNRGEAMPTAITEQVDAGFRYIISPRLKLVGGVFQVEKPYFALNTANIYGALGSVRHRGVELSLTGQVFEGLTMVAGAILIQPRLSGDAVDRGVVGRVPVGPRPLYTLVALQYRAPSWKQLLLDAQISFNSSRMARADNLLKVPAFAELTLGARYNFRLYDTPMTLRGNVSNVTNVFVWNAMQAGNVSARGQRRFNVSLTADF